MILSDRNIRELCTNTNSTAVDIIPPVDLGNGIVKHASQQIIETPNGKPMIEGFVDHLVREENGRKVVSYGLSSYGYDIRLAPEFRIFNKPNDGRVIDVLNFDEELFTEYVKADRIILPPGGLVLSRSIERFNMPRAITGVCQGKSTWARIGASVLVTPLEAGWSGELVVEITNSTNNPMIIYAGMGIAQITFHMGTEPCETSYSDRGGKYQDQTGVTLARL